MKTVLTLVPCLWLLPPASQAQEIDLAGYADLSTSAAGWTGQYALPVPDEVADLAGGGVPRDSGESVRRNVGEGTGVAEIRAARTASNAALAAHDVEAITSFWTEDVAITAGSGTAAIGRDTWRRAIAAQLERYPDVIYIRTPDAIKLSAVTPIASEHGTWTGTWSSENGPVTSGGEYQAMWRRDPDGWRLRSQLFVTLSCEGAGCAGTRTP